MKHQLADLQHDVPGQLGAHLDGWHPPGDPLLHHYHREHRFCAFWRWSFVPQSHLGLELPPAGSGLLVIHEHVPHRQEHPLTPEVAYGGYHVESDLAPLGPGTQRSLVVPQLVQEAQVSPCQPMSALVSPGRRRLWRPEQNSIRFL